MNYVKITWTDSAGIERVVYPAINTSNPFPILQDANYEYLFDEQSNEVVSAQQSETQKKFQKPGTVNSSVNRNVNDVIPTNESLLNNYGRRYGMSPQQAQINGVFYIDPLQGVIFFDSSFVGRVVTLKYISDGISGNEEDKTVHKFAEEALYKYIAYAILSTRANTPEYLVSRFKRERAAAKRNAKLRLSNIKIEEITQVMRNKSKILKH